jgi:predicted outer membrane repeat protein
LFRIPGGGGINFGASFVNLHLSDGDVNGSGGAIHTTVEISLQNCVVENNHAQQHGGAIFAAFDTITAESSIFNTLFQGNTANGHGGAVAVDSPRSGLIVSQSEFRGNQSIGEGGGLSARFTEGGLGLFIEQSTFADNMSTGNVGGGITARVRSALLGIRQTTISGNKAVLGNGGGAYLDASGSTTVQLSDLTLLGNQSNEPGGGISLVRHDTSSVEMSRLDIRSNTALVGGGMDIRGASSQMVRLLDSTIAGNSANHGGGISIALSGNGGVLIEGSTIHGNSAIGNGGGLWLIPSTGDVEVLNSTISGNSARSNGGGIYSGAAPGSTITLRHSTIAFNMARTLLTSYGRGGGVYNRVLSSLTLDHTIVGNNQANVIDDDLHGHFHSGYSLIEQPGNATFQGVGHDLLGVDPDLEPLANNGGPTPTHALRSSSPAINSGDPQIVNAPAFDQRGSGFGRVQFGRIDRGAFEYDTPPTGDFDANGAFDCQDIDRLVAAIAAARYEVNLDMDRDGDIDRDDLARWLVVAGAANLPGGAPYRPGDANLDGFVDREDFDTWNANVFQPIAAWCSGDFSADGFVDGVDFGIWNSHQSKPTDRGRRELRRPTVDFQAQHVIPEQYGLSPRACKKISWANMKEQGSAAPLFFHSFA